MKENKTKISHETTIERTAELPAVLADNVTESHLSETDSEVIETKITITDTDNTSVPPESLKAEILDELKILKELSTEIHNELAKVESSHLLIAWKLGTIYKSGLYTKAKCKSFSQFASQCFNLKKTQTSNYIKICENFCEYNEEEKRYTGIKNKFKDYSHSQLVEMINMSAEDRGKVTPNTSVREMRDMKKSKKTKKLEDKSEEAVKKNSKSDPDKKDNKEKNNTAKKNSAKLNFSEFTDDTKKELLKIIQDFLDNNHATEYAITISKVK